MLARYLYQKGRMSRGFLNLGDRYINLADRCKDIENIQTLPHKYDH